MTSDDTFLHKLNMHKKRNAGGRKGLISIISNSEKIVSGIKRGHTLKTIYEVLSEEGEVTVSYSSFVKHVRKHLLPKQSARIHLGTQRDQLDNKTFKPENHDINNLI